MNKIFLYVFTKIYIILEMGAGGPKLDKKKIFGKHCKDKEFKIIIDKK